MAPWNRRPRTGLILFCLPLLCTAALAGPLRAADDGEGLMALYFDKNELVESASHIQKPISQVAENVTIITADEIGRLNAHSMYEVLERVAGVEIVYYNGRNLNGQADVTIQGSRTEHVLVLLDGVRLNTASGGNVSFALVPLGIISRIEIIKGPASAAWGSSLGGVINILTKRAGTSARPYGTLSGSYGENRTSDLSGDVAGAVGRLGYYLYAGHQETDGFVANRWFENTALYAKGELPLPHGLQLTATVGSSAPDYNAGDFHALDFDELIKDEYHHGTVNLTAPISPALHLNLGLRHLTRDYDKSRSFLGLGTSYFGATPAGDLYYREGWEEESSGALLRLAWTPANHQLMLGAETNRGEVSKKTGYGAWAQANWGAPAEDPVAPVFEETSGIYLNDTITWGRWAVTPGVRYDQHSISKDLTSPSLGVTYQLRPDTLLRGLVAQGFVHPVLSYLKVSDWSFAANQGLMPEEITSYQLGLETTALPWVSIKTNLFRHEVTDSWSIDYNDIGVPFWKNGSDLSRQGVEVELETVPVAGFSAVTNVSVVEFIPDDPAQKNDSSSTANLILRYDDKTALQAELAGRYVWWDTYQSVSPTTGGGEYGNLLWDLRLNRRLCTTGRTTTTAFFTTHNLFNGRETAYKNFYENPDRWLEAGVKLQF